MARKPDEFDNHPFEFESNPKYRAHCQYVVDGDTYDFLIDIGFNKYAYESIRLHGLDTPEIRTYNKKEKKLGYKAKARAEELILDKQVILETFKDKSSFGRYEARVFYWENDDWVNLADTLREEGFEK